jgi:hypothetical protein
MKTILALILGFLPMISHAEMTRCEIIGQTVEQAATLRDWGVKRSEYITTIRRVHKKYHITNADFKLLVFATQQAYNNPNVSAWDLRDSVVKSCSKQSRK